MQPSPHGQGDGQPQIVATFPYVDENGKLLFESLRREPGAHGARKDFRQRRPDGKGGWVWNLEGVRRVLYRLPELLNADRDWQVVFIPEGEKCVDRLIAEGLVATCNPMGANKWTADLSPSLKGCDCILLADNDDIGRKHVNDVACQLNGIARSVRILHLPGLAEKEDVFDWLEKGGDKLKLLEMALAAPIIGRVLNHDADEPTDSPAAAKADNAKEMLPFPSKLFGEPIANYIRQCAVSIGCDEAFIALPILTCLGAAVGNSRWIKLKNGWCEPPVIWTMTVGVSGKKKSPGLRAAVLFHNRRQEQLDHEHKNAIRDWRAVCREDPDAVGDKPARQRVYTMDTTMEQGITILHESAQRSLLIYRDELSAWFAGFNQYRPGKSGSDREYWLSAYNADPILYDRKGSSKKNGEATSIHVVHGFLTITGGIQPKIMVRCLEEDMFNCGMVARFMFAAPPQRKAYWSEVEVHPDTLAAMDGFFSKLWSLKMRKGPNGISLPEYLSFDAEAKARWVEWFNWLQDEKDFRQGNLASAWSKLEAFCARLALVLHLCRWAGNEEVDPEVIDLQTMVRAIEMWSWFAAETERIYAMLGDHPELTVEQRLVLDWVRASGDPTTVREVHRKFQARFHSSEDAEECLEVLVVKKLLRRLPAEPRAGGGHAPMRYVFQLSHDT
jgi:Protein of unknown function (DUF3987)